MRPIHRQATAARLDVGGDFLRDVVQGLGREPKAIPPKYFYDAAGSALFDRICELPEYYPTRTECDILERSVGEIAQTLGPRVQLVEPGAGSGLKTRLLLAALMDPVGYVPVDISGAHLQASAAALRAEFPGIDILPVEADFTHRFALPRPSMPPLRRALFFPGSTLGNFEPDAARRLLAQFRELAGRDGRLLLGIDLQKDVAVLEPAYDDTTGVTARFNLNLLARINRELEGNFDAAAFAHRAFYNPEHARIEMHLLSLRDQVVRVAGRAFRFRRGEMLHTENSYKYTMDGVVQLARRGGWRPLRQWSDARGWFAVCLFAAA